MPRKLYCRTMISSSQIDGNIVNQISRRSRPQVMIVDDDPIIRCVLAGTLNRGGYDTVIFGSATEALTAFDRLELDLVVADWIMAGLDGLSFIDALKDRAPEMPAILITSYGGHETVRRAGLDGRVDAVLSKPFDLRNFLETVSSFIHKSIAPFGGFSGGFSLDLDKADGLDDENLWQTAVSHESYYERILGSIIDAVVMVDQYGNVIYRNRGADRMFKIKEQPGRRLTFSELCPSGSRLRNILESYFTPHPPVEEQCEGVFLRSDGEEFKAMFSVSRFESDYHAPAVLLVVKNVADNHDLEKIVSEKTRDLERLAITDPLTGLFNRRHFDRRFEEELKRVERYNSPLTMIMIDFDHFKLINDIHGHLIGDRVLSIAASELAAGLRDVDVLARWGGEEYMVLLPETGRETGLTAARRLHGLIVDCDKWAGLDSGLKVTASLGVVDLPWDKRPATMNGILDFLDKALYKAKGLGRNRIIHYCGLTDTFKVV